MTAQTISPGVWRLPALLALGLDALCLRVRAGAAGGGVGRGAVASGAPHSHLELVRASSFGGRRGKGLELLRALLAALDRHRVGVLARGARGRVDRAGQAHALAAL